MIRFLLGAPAWQPQMNGMAYRNPEA